MFQPAKSDEIFLKVGTPNQGTFPDKNVIIPGKHTLGLKSTHSLSSTVV